MDRTSYTNLAKTWEFAEDHAFARQSAALNEARLRAQEAGFPQGSAAQAELLATLVHLVDASSAIVIGTGSIVETLQVINGLDGTGQLTAVDSSAQGIVMIRSLFSDLADDVTTKLRAVNAPAGVFLPRLNGDDYDLIVVAGDPANYAAAFEQAPRLLRPHGTVVFTDVLAMQSPESNGGVLNPADRSDKAVAMREFIETVEADERFVSTLTPTGTGLLLAVKR
ncbi:MULTISPECIES: O-methyltransferase [Bifidobacterium]|uniref:O-methyltransferase n=1 Tax=Bifidobacterium TaxID=1678 RepID=UPI001BDBEEF5|nr:MULTISPECIES: methyltransferase [Bifidobacterium]MBT1161597.1 methyltransferase [Bifidobacterium sp. SO1]MBW3078789.1 methyltransferase [Bifidobacterium simiiventris]